MSAWDRATTNWFNVFLHQFDKIMLLFSMSDFQERHWLYYIFTGTHLLGNHKEKKKYIYKLAPAKYQSFQIVKITGRKPRCHTKPGTQNLKFISQHFASNIHNNLDHNNIKHFIYLVYEPLAYFFQIFALSLLPVIIYWFYKFVLTEMIRSCIWLIWLNKEGNKSINARTKYCYNVHGPILFLFLTGKLSLLYVWFPRKAWTDDCVNFLLCNNIAWHCPFWPVRFNRELESILKVFSFK